MKLATFRENYPEYADMSDDDVIEFIGGETEETEEETEICAPGIEAALADIAKLLTNIVTHIKKEKPQEKREQLTGQLAAIEAALRGISFPEQTATVVNIPEGKDIEWLDVKRDEFGAIIRLVPKYRV